MRALITIPLLILLVLFALSNTQVVRMGFWPTGYTVDLPVSLAVLIGMGFAFLVGALFVWIGELGQRRRARRSEHTVRLLEEKIRELQARRPGPVVLPPPT